MKGYPHTSGGRFTAIIGIGHDRDAAYIPLGLTKGLRLVLPVKIE